MIPENRKDRENLLQKAKEILKSEFVGLDTIIDEISEAISAWYITPEIINRPVIISLWGMTGTGKSSVVSRLMELLGLTNNTLFFDCGECISESKNIGSIIEDTLGISGDDDDVAVNPNISVSEKYSRRPVFVFDEFQYARTIDDEMHEDVKPSLRPIWSIIDTGMVDSGNYYSWGFNQLCSFLEDLESFISTHSGIIVENNMINDRDAVKIFLENLGFIYYPEREIPGITTNNEVRPILSRSKGSSSSKMFDDEEKEDPYRPLKVIDRDLLKTVFRKLNQLESGAGVKAVKKILMGKWELEDFCSYLLNIRNRISITRKIDCSNSLVFIIGNLDEAYNVSKELSPDVDADVFYDITSKVTISDIKTALMKRFRPEQIARLGNNLIKYPTLGKDSFMKIIRGEVNRILNDFKKVHPIDIEIGEEIYELLYTEGVFPAQGVRPIFTTIGSILTPYLSKIILGAKDSEKVTILIDNIDEVKIKKFKTDSVDIILKFSNREEQKYKHNLQLGSIRNPEARKKRYICSVHEAGHAVALAWRTGNAPGNIVSVSVDHGGFCSTYDKESEGEIQSRRDIDNDIIISLAGYVAESIIFKDRPDMCLMGSGSDIEELWESISENAFRVGYFKPIMFSNTEVEDSNSIPGGLNSKNRYVNYFDGEKFSNVTMPLEDAIEKRLNELIKETQFIIEREQKLIINLAIYLGKYGSMDKNTFLDYVDKYGNELCREKMQEMKEYNSPENYIIRLVGKIKTI